MGVTEETAGCEETSTLEGREDLEAGVTEPVTVRAIKSSCRNTVWGKKRFRGDSGSFQISGQQGQRQLSMRAFLIARDGNGRPLFGGWGRLSD